VVVRRLGGGGRVEFGLCCYGFFEMVDGRVHDVVDVVMLSLRIAACEWEGSWLEKEDALSLLLLPKSFPYTQSRLDGTYRPQLLYHYSLIALF
jgi:hypothetical protein